MITFSEYQNLAAKVPVAVRNDRDRIELPVLGLQAEAGKLGRLLSVAFASGKFRLTPAQTGEAKDRMADMIGRSLTLRPGARRLPGAAALSRIWRIILTLAHSGFVG